MAKSYISILQNMIGRFTIDSHIRATASETVKDFFKERLVKHGITNISEEDIEELSQDLVDELCMQEYSYGQK